VTAARGLQAALIALDGVVWRGESPVPGSADAVRRLRDGGMSVVLVHKNN
jgi:ribonucleotide monophosphatase NagD (HAD superfamily)